MTMIEHYEVHWAKANRADKVSALRSGAVRHATREQAVIEAARIAPPWPDLVTIVVPVRR